MATFVAMTGNFILNNLLTYRDRRLSGRRFVTGLLSFYAVCSLGAAANVGVAAAVFANNYTWWVSGLAGVLVGVVSYLCGLVTDHMGPQVSATRPVDYMGSADPAGAAAALLSG